MQPQNIKNNSRYSLGKKERLNDTRVINQIRKLGVSLKAFPLKITALENSCGFARLVLVFTKRSGNSVVRNRMKRLSREFFRNHKNELRVADYLVFGMGNLEKLNRQMWDKIALKWLEWAKR